MTHAIPTMPKYESYKNSEIDWIGGIPEHWELLRLGSHFEERRTKVSDKDFAPLSVTKRGVVPQLESAAKTNDGDNRKLVKKGDFVINSRSDRKGSSGIAFQDGSVSLINTVLQPKKIHTIYCNYLLKSNGFVEEFYRMGHGIVADLWTTRYDEMSSIILGIPTLEEQRKIANFLDKKTEQVDKAIRMKEQQIALLKERKQIIIQNAVTRGLNSTAPMKNSGIDWIGDIPAHWDIKPLMSETELKSVTNCTDRELLSVYLDLGVIRFSDVDQKRTNATSLDLSGYQVVDPGDFVLNNQQAWRGSVGVSKYTGIISPAYIVLTLSDNFDIDYANYLLRSSVMVAHYLMASKGVGTIQRNLYWQHVKRMHVFIPPLREQQEIVSYISEKTSEIDLVINSQETQNNKLKEYKASLINSAVTGKIKVIGE